jgi:Ricin-type beta-trefoil lectin domain
VKLFSLFAVRIASTSLIGSTIALSILASSALAETFQVSGNKSLNTNNQFAPIDGHPRMAVYESKNSDPDQNFDRLAGKWGVLFRNRSTNMCINAYYNYDRGAVSNWPCDANDPAQNFDLLGQGGNTVLLRKSNTNFCLNVPYHVNEGQVNVWTCDTKDADQRFLMGNVTGSGGSGVLYPPITVTPPITPPKQPVIQTFNFPSTTLYEAWIVSRKYEGLVPSFTNIGHSFIAIVRKKQKTVVTFRDGVKVSTSSPQDDGNWDVHRTYGYWLGNGLGVIQTTYGCGLRDKKNVQDADCYDTKDILNGISISNRGQAVRKARISEARANWLINNPNFGNVTGYTLDGVWFGSGSPGNCVTYATLQWKNITANQDNWVPTNVYFSAGKRFVKSNPGDLVEYINSKNQSTGNQFIDNGNTWQ